MEKKTFIKSAINKLYQKQFDLYRDSYADISSYTGAAGGDNAQKLFYLSKKLGQLSMAIEFLEDAGRNDEFLDLLYSKMQEHDWQPSELADAIADNEAVLASWYKFGLDDDVIYFVEDL